MSFLSLGMESMHIKIKQANLKQLVQGWQDGSVCKDACHHAWQPAFDNPSHTHGDTHTQINTTENPGKLRQLSFHFECIILFQNSNMGFWNGEILLDALNRCQGTKGLWFPALPLPVRNLISQTEKVSMFLTGHHVNAIQQILTANV